VLNRMSRGSTARGWRLAVVGTTWVVCVSVGAARAAPQAAPAAAVSDVPPPQAVADELARLRQELEALRQQTAALEARLAALEARAVAAPQAAPTALAPGEAPVPAGAAGAGGPSGSLPVYGNPNLFSKIFNPDMSVIGNVIGTAGRNSLAPSPGLAFDEAEATFQAIVDPYARADFFFGISPEGIEIEEGYLTFPTLPGGVLMKVGQMYPQVGKVNTLHTHQISTIDRPLVARALFGEAEGQFNDVGVSVSRLVMNPWVFLEATGEVLSGHSSVFTAHEPGQLAYVGRLRAYRDVTEASNVDVGASVAYGHNETGPAATTRLVVLDATWRYRPLQRAIYRRALVRTELMWSRREQAEGVASAFGAYGQGDYQFARRWFAGVRFDYAERPATPALADRGASVILTYWPSEFSQIRGQYRRTRYAERVTAHEVLFQFQFSIGAHGAHVF
jgi:hypothetical protein